MAHPQMFDDDDPMLEVVRSIALALPGIQLAPLEPAIAVHSTKLPGTFHTDPADRIIVATALAHAALVLTPDERIRAYPHVQSAW